MKQIKKSLFAFAAALALVITAMPVNAKAETSTDFVQKSDDVKAATPYTVYVGDAGTCSCGGYTVSSWSSSNTKVVKVEKYSSTQGYVKFLKAGTAHVYAVIDGVKQDAFVFTVKTSTTLSSKKPTVEKGKTKTVKASLKYAGTVSASSSNTGVCKVSVSKVDSYNAKIKLTGVKAGTATVTVKNKNTKTGITEKVTMKVTVKSASVMSLSASSASVKKGDSATVKATLTKSGTVKATSAKTSVATVKVTKVDSKHAKIKITGKGVGSTTITVKNSVNSEKLTIKVTVKSASAKTERRAVVIAQEYAGTSSALPACAKDGIAMQKMLKQTGYSEVTIIKEASYSKVKSTIEKAFADADSDDVSLVYYTGHGASDGSLCTLESGSVSASISPATLAGWLKKVPGKIVFMTDSCYSGQFIDKNVDADYANNQIIKAFAENNATLKSGEMCTSKFQVITASSKYQYSWCNQSYGYFTYYLVKGVGFDYSGNKMSSAPADKDGNKKLTTHECWKYAYDNVSTMTFQGEKQYPRVYPSNSTFQMFKR